MARRTQQEAEQTRQAIIDAAFVVLSEQGLAKLTLNKVAQQAGVSRSSIYWHFEDRETLLLALSELAMAPFLIVYNQIDSTHGESLRQILLQTATQMLESLLRDPKVQLLSKLSQQWVADATFLEKYRPLHSERNRQFESHMLRLQQDGVLQPHLTPKSACLIFTAFLSGIFEQWLIEPESMSSEDIPELVISLDKALFVK